MALTHQFRSTQPPMTAFLVGLLMGPLDVLDELYLPKSLLIPVFVFEYRPNIAFCWLLVERSKHALLTNGGKICTTCSRYSIPSDLRTPAKMYRQ